MNERNPCIGEMSPGFPSMQSKANTVLEALNEFLHAPTPLHRQAAQKAMQVYLAEVNELTDRSIILEVENVPGSKIG